MGPSQNTRVEFPKAKRCTRKVIGPWPVCLLCHLEEGWGIPDLPSALEPVAAQLEKEHCVYLVRLGPLVPESPGR